MKKILAFIGLLFGNKGEVKAEGWGVKQFKLLKKFGQSPILMSMSL